MSFARNLLSLTGAEIFCRFLTFATVTYLARILTSDGFGIISFSLALLSFAFLLSDLGLKTFGSRDLAQGKQDVVDTVMSVRLLLVPVSFVLLVVVANLLDISRTHTAVIILYSLSLFIELFLIEWLFFGLQELRFISIARVARVLTYSVLVFIFVKTSNDVVLVPVFYGAGLLVAATYLMSRYGKVPAIKFSLTLKNWQASLSQALPMGFGYIMTQIYYNFDSIMLGIYKGSRVVGLYNGGYKIVFFLITFFLLYHQTLLAVLSKFYSKDRHKFNVTANHAAKYITYFSLPVSLGGSILAAELISQIFGDSYLGGVLAFRILLWTFLANNLAALFGNILVASHKQMTYMIGVTIGAVSNVVLNIILIPKYSLVGAAVSTLVAQIGVFFYMYSVSQQLHGFLLHDVLSLLLKPVIAGVAMAITLYLMQDMYWMLRVVPAGTIYLAVLFLLKGISTTELRTFARWVVVRESHGSMES